MADNFVYDVSMGTVVYYVASPMLLLVSITRRTGGRLIIFIIISAILLYLGLFCCLICPTYRHYVLKTVLPYVDHFGCYAGDTICTVTEDN